MLFAKFVQNSVVGKATVLMQSSAVMHKIDAFVAVLWYAHLYQNHFTVDNGRVVDVVRIDARLRVADIVAF